MDPDFLAGSVGGCLAKLIDFPADTIKVLLQTQQSREMTAWSCLRDTIQQEGVASLYRGISSPLLGAVAENAVLFGAYAECQRLLLRPDQSELTTWQRAWAGAGAGVAVSFVLTPVELVKCRMQVQTAPNAVQYKGPWDVLSRTWRQEGWKGLYRGHGSTMLREIPGNFCFFGVYELVYKFLSPEGGGTKGEDLDFISTLTAGSLSGIAYWTAFYPADTVKSVLQTRQLSGSDISFTKLFLEIYRMQGIPGLYRGYGITVARAAPATAIIFLGYEYTLQLLTGKI